ncbi:DUF4189 domain-containing protein [Methylocystis parvus]|uniref:DUF4189 domain-containing protein n=1 Tax=Methylocystis parvus TaxID=134 RepID=UPI003C749D4E
MFRYAKRLTLLLSIAASVLAILSTAARGEAAVAFGQFGLGEWSSGAASNVRTSAAAQDEAMQNCRARGQRCTIVRTFNKSCVAVAAQDGDNEYAVIVNRDLNVARRTAMAECEEKGLECVIAEAFCDNISETEILAAERKKSDAEQQAFQRQWRKCFGAGGASRDTPSEILACDEAAGFSALQPTDRDRLTQQREKLFALQETARQNREREEEENRQRLAREEQEIHERMAREEKQARLAREAQEAFRRDQAPETQGEAEPREEARIIAQPDTRHAGRALDTVTRPTASTLNMTFHEALRGIPLSTWITGSVAGVLAVLLGVTLAQQRKRPMISFERRLIAFPAEKPKAAGEEVSITNSDSSGSNEPRPLVADELRPEISTHVTGASSFGAMRAKPLDTVGKYIASAPVYVVLYLLFMIPTYFLAILGSNSILLNSTGAGISPQFWFHFALMIMLSLLTWVRGRHVDKPWLVTFPFLAIVFDFIPVLSSIPLVPTVMHLLAIILGASASRADPIRTTGGA